MTFVDIEIAFSLLCTYVDYYIILFFEIFLVTFKEYHSICQHVRINNIPNSAINNSAGTTKITKHAMQ